MARPGEHECRLSEVPPAEVGNDTVGGHETAGLSNVGHGSVEGEGEVGLDAAVSFEVRNGLVGECHSIATAITEVLLCEISIWTIKGLR